MAALSDFLTATRRLLNDSADTYWSPAAKTAMINEAIQQRDLDCQANRANYQFTLTIGTANYSAQTVQSTGTLLFGVNSPTNIILDVVNIVLIYSGLRILLDKQPYSTLTAWYQNVQNYTFTPAGFAQYGVQQVVLAPIPNQAYVTEWDMLFAQPVLVNQTDTDLLPYPWTDLVPFLAAHFAKLQLQEQSEADRYYQIYQERLVRILSATRGSFVPSPYGSIPLGWIGR